MIEGAQILGGWLNVRAKAWEGQDSRRETPACVRLCVPGHVCRFKIILPFIHLVVHLSRRLIDTQAVWYPARDFHKNTKFSTLEG